MSFENAYIVLKDDNGNGGMRIAYLHQHQDQIITIMQSETRYEDGQFEPAMSVEFPFGEMVKMREVLNWWYNNMDDDEKKRYDKEK